MRKVVVASLLASVSGLELALRSLLALPDSWCTPELNRTLTCCVTDCSFGVIQFFFVISGFCLVDQAIEVLHLGPALHLPAFLLAVLVVLIETYVFFWLFERPLIHKTTRPASASAGRVLLLLSAAAAGTSAVGANE